MDRAPISTFTNRRFANYRSFPASQLRLRSACTVHAIHVGILVFVLCDRQNTGQWDGSAWFPVLVYLLLTMEEGWKEGEVGRRRD